MTERHDLLHEREEDDFVAALDPAQQSLADALRWTFRLLKWAMVVMLVLYLFSGMFNIEQQEVGVRLRFGNVVSASESGNEVLEPGGPYFAWPFPIEQVVRIPRDVQQVTLDTPFWYETHKSQGTKTEDERGGRPGPLNPEKDGFLLTGDANICHAQFSLTYGITDPTEFMRNIGDPASKEKMLEAAEAIVRSAAEQAIVYTVAQMTADHFQKGLTAGDIDVAKKRMKTILDTLESGIEVQTISADRTEFPLSVRNDFRAVTNAESEKAKLIEDAVQHRKKTLIKTAGRAYEAILELIDKYEQANQSQDTVGQAALDEQLDRAFRGLEIDTDDGPRRIGGDVAVMINEAKTYRTQVVAEMRAEAASFESLLPQYRKNPDIVLNRLWQDAIEEIFAAGDEMIWVPKGQAWIKLGRDQELQKRREQERLLKEQAAKFGP